METLNVFRGIAKHCATLEEADYLYDLAVEILEPFFLHLFLISIYVKWKWSLPSEVLTKN